ncbi:hypothetical protein [Thermaurantiacus sp.]
MNRPNLSSLDRISLKSTPLLLLVGDIPLPESLALRARCLRSDVREAPPSRPDVAIIRADALDRADLVRLQAPEWADVPLIIIADANSADTAGALLGHAIAGFLAPDFEAAELEALVHGALSPAGPGVADTSRPLDPRLEAIRQEVERMTAAIAAMARGTDLLQPPPVTASRIRAHIKARRLRESFFPAGLFADPAWDILLDLGAARREGRPVSVSSLCIAAAVPTTTALRWIKTMVDTGMLARRPDRSDARRAFIELAPATSETLDRCLEACFNLPGL